MNPILACAFFVCLGASTGAKAPPQGVQVGDVPRYAFQRPVQNGMGAASLEDLRGKPVFIEFWGRKAAAVDDTMRDVLAWQNAWGDDLAVLFVEVKQATDLQVAGLALEKKWLGGRAMWTTERPCDVGLKGALPQFVLLSGEGTVLLKGTTESFELGYRNELVDEIESRLREEVERRRRGPADAPPQVVRAYEAFSRGRIQEALELAGTLSADGDAALAAAAGVALETFRERLARRLAHAEWQVANGWLPAAEEGLAALEGALAAEPALASRHAELHDALRAEALAAEWKAATELARLEEKLYAKGPKKSYSKQLARLVEEHAGTKSADRAAFLLEAARAADDRP